MSPVLAAEALAEALREEQAWVASRYAHVHLTWAQEVERAADRAQAVTGLVLELEETQTLKMLGGLK